MKRLLQGVTIFISLAMSGSPVFSQALPSSLQQEVVATVGDRVITLEQFNQLLERNPEVGSAKLTPDKKKALLEKYLNRLIYLEGARRMQLAERPEVMAKIEEATTSILVNEFLRLQVIEPSKVSEDEAKAYWKKHRDEFINPLQARVRHILITIAPGGNTDDEARKRIEEVAARIRTGEEFDVLATQYSEDPGTKARGGDLGFVSPGRMVPEFDAAVFALKAGEVSGPVKTQYGYHLIKVEERIEPTPRTYEVSRELIHGKLSRQKQRDRLESVLDNLKESMKIESNPRIFEVEN